MFNLFDYYGGVIIDAPQKRSLTENQMRVKRIKKKRKVIQTRKGKKKK